VSHLTIDLGTALGLPPSPAARVTGVSSTAPGNRILFTRTAPNRFEADVADPATSSQLVTITASDRGVWDKEVSILINAATGVVTRGILLIPVPVSRASDGSLRIQLDLVLLRLRDVTAETAIAMPATQSVLSLSSPILNPAGGTGRALLNGTQVDQPVFQNLLFIVRWHTPRVRLALYVPAAARDSLGSYHMFFKPAPVLGFPAVLDRYIVSGGEQIVQKHIPGQCEASTSAYVLVFPFPEDGPFPGAGANPAGVLEVLGEVDLFLRDALLQSADFSGIENIALSCFSFGCATLAAIFNGTGTDALFDKLTDVYIFDGRDNASTIRTLAGQLKSWFANGAFDQSLRIYETEGLFGSIFAGTDAPATGSRITGPNGAFELHSVATNSTGSPSATYLFAPLQFWVAFDPSLSDFLRGAHQAIPRFFIADALRTSAV
jgi:hypothetical protein